MKYKSILCSIVVLISIGCTHKIVNGTYFKPKIDNTVLRKLTTLEESFISDNIYYINNIDSLPNGVYILWAIKDRRTYKILTHKMKDYETFRDGLSNVKIQVGNSYPLILQSWRETNRPKDLSEYSCTIRGCEYYGNYITINDSDIEDLFFANYVDGLYLPK